MAESNRGIHATEEIFGSVETALKGSDSLPTDQESFDDRERLRGVVALPHDRRILLTDEVELGPGTLPRWRPQILVDNRHVDLNDEDE